VKKLAEAAVSPYNRKRNIFSSERKLEAKK